MDEAFWQARWAQGQIGFHQGEVNPYLQRYWPELALNGTGRVLVPLCGKSLDMAWLAAQGHQVLGVELARQAVEGFFAERGLTPQVSQLGAFEVYRGGNIELWCGDFFELRAEHLRGCTALYDRAALIALPAPMRQRYTAHLNRLLAPGSRGLLVTLDYAQAQMEGPPFAVSDAEVRSLFAAGWQVESLEACDVLAENERFRQRGLQYLDERVYRLSRG
ncbi:thiopurine S-methyltransferase [Pseudomonas benzenivorans]|uniref:Thiopurine S-methyltransferase n=1 Tax=Pseudomonas benzenivorans TaxID=556533 RepID=A0ABZ0PR01_9PSED|nr:thiopurine S-methyltransferase [Pseudomonas benzenivorans]WPC03588.1 thiopurine S-methyltransferase [Pseudomonas benzenivorans]